MKGSSRIAALEDYCTFIEREPGPLGVTGPLCRNYKWERGGPRSIYWPCCFLYEDGIFFKGPQPGHTEEGGAEADPALGATIL